MLNKAAAQSVVELKDKTEKIELVPSSASVLFILFRPPPPSPHLFIWKHEESHVFNGKMSNLVQMITGIKFVYQLIIASNEEVVFISICRLIEQFNS